MVLVVFIVVLRHLFIPVLQYLVRDLAVFPVLLLRCRRKLVQKVRNRVLEVRPDGHCRWLLVLLRRFENVR